MCFLLNVIQDKGCHVGFFNNIRGFIPTAQLGRLSGTPQESFVPGMIVKCRVLSAVPATKRLTVSLLLAETAPDPRVASGPKSFGDLTEGQVLYALHCFH